MTDAERLIAEGLSLEDDGDRTGAERAYRDALARSPSWSVPHYNLGLLCKYQGRWQESLAFNQQAAALAPDDEAAWWNLGIAATALGDWAEARRAALLRRRAERRGQRSESSSTLLCVSWRHRRGQEQRGRLMAILGE